MKRHRDLLGLRRPRVNLMDDLERTQWAGMVDARAEIAARLRALAVRFQRVDPRAVNLLEALAAECDMASTWDGEKVYTLDELFP